ncbi:MAG: hypothetical protein COC15_00390 [Legionellales bacterium]|nr:MAG: hypothetical protein COC15_00390 [Legionellales bacterium]
MTNNGYTLIELVLVIVLIGVLSISAIPKLFNPTSFTERFYYDEVKAVLRLAQKLSVASGCDTEVITTANSMSIAQRTACANIGSFDVNIRTINIENDNVILTTILNEFPIYFDALGRAVNSTSNLVANSSIDVNTRTINIVGVTGLIYDAD